MLRCIAPLLLISPALLCLASERSEHVHLVPVGIGKHGHYYLRDLVPSKLTALTEAEPVFTNAEIKEAHDQQLQQQALRPSATVPNPMLRPMLRREDPGYDSEGFVEMDVVPPQAGSATSGSATSGSSTSGSATSGSATGESAKSGSAKGGSASPQTGSTQGRKTTHGDKKKAPLKAEDTHGNNESETVTNEAPTPKVVAGNSTNATGATDEGSKATTNTPTPRPTSLLDNINAGAEEQSLPTRAPTHSVEEPAPVEIETSKDPCIPDESETDQTGGPEDLEVKQPAKKRPTKNKKACTPTKPPTLPPHGEDDLLAAQIKNSPAIAEQASQLKALSQRGPLFIAVAFISLCMCGWLVGGCCTYLLHPKFDTNPQPEPTWWQAFGCPRLTDDE